MAYAPTLTPKIDFAPVPRVEIVFATMPAAAVTATVYRIADNRTFRVRGGVDVAASGGFTVPPDAEAPFETDVAYRAEMFDAAGTSLGFTDPTSTFLDFAGTVIHQPTDPSRNVQVEVLDGTAPDLVRPFAGARVLPRGRTLPVFIGSGRLGVESVALRVLTRTAVQQEALLNVFGAYGDNQVPVICFRSSLNIGVPKPLFLLVQEPHVIGYDRSIGGEHTKWQLDGSETSPAIEAIVTALLTYADLEASYATYSAFEAAYLTYLAAESDYSLAGAV